MKTTRNGKLPAVLPPSTKLRRVLAAASKTPQTISPAEQVQRHLASAHKQLQRWSEPEKTFLRRQWYLIDRDTGVLLDLLKDASHVRSR